MVVGIGLPIGIGVVTEELLKHRLEIEKLI